MFEQVIFYALGAVLILAATMVITVRNPVHSALFLVLAFITSGGLWLLLEAEFLAITLVLVYVGAVMVLFLFVVMMLDINLAPMREGFARYLPVAATVAVLMVVAMALAVGPAHFGLDVFPDPPGRPADYSNTKSLGGVIYTNFVYPLEIAAVILLLAIIAAIALAMRPSRRTKTQKPEWQVSVRKEDRVRIIKMAPEKKR